MARISLTGALALMLIAAGAAAGARLPADGGAALRSEAVPPRAPPSLPESYTVNYTFTLPYTARIQQPPISYPVAMYRDAPGKRLRMDTYGSTQVMLAKKGKTRELVPRIDRLACLEFDDAGGDEARLSALPDVAGWAFGGEEALNGEPAEVWVFEARHEGKHVVYKFYASPDGTPRRLHMHGNDMISGSHFDEWVVDYTLFEPGRPDPVLFETPELCKGPSVQTASRGVGKSGVQLRWAALAPSVRYAGDAEYDAFLAAHGAGRAHTSLAEYRRRAAQLRANRQLVDAHNASPGRTFTMALNRWGDYSDEEFAALVLPRRARVPPAGLAPADASENGCAAAGDRTGLARHQLPYEPLAEPGRLPGALSWRGTGADAAGVKDQATCGSCWSFAATGAMEGAWWRATGAPASFSEQQVLDCSWGYEPKKAWANLACDGGDPEAAIGYVVQAGGIAANTDYPYRGQDGYCAANTTRLQGRFKGFARVPRCDDAALREALYSRGPLAISFDASRPSFRFYSAGVYVDTECEWRPDQLDHSMVLVGYGSGPAGDYWEVKNSWSTHWGDRGYFKVSRDVNHACGVPSDAYYAVADAP